jgi:hypothetical protein
MTGRINFVDWGRKPGPRPGFTPRVRVSLPSVGSATEATEPEITRIMDS